MCHFGWALVLEGVLEGERWWGFEGEQPSTKMHHMGAFLLFGCKYRHIVHAGVQREAERLSTMENTPYDG